MVQDSLKHLLSHDGQSRGDVASSATNGLSIPAAPCVEQSATMSYSQRMDQDAAALWCSRVVDSYEPATALATTGEVVP
jgi:hypothetical protein